MKQSLSQRIADLALADQDICLEDGLKVLSAEESLISLVAAAFEVRQKHFGKTVTVHILNNVQNGYCPEDCRYCAQSASSRAPIEEYPLKSDEEIMAEAKSAYEQGAHRYCMVFAGRGPSDPRVDHLTRLIKDIKKNWKLEVCVSTGSINQAQARKLKEAGLDRLNHNLNTSESYYSSICSTHTYADRLDTLRSAKKEGLSVCSGVIVGMGESREDLYKMASALREIKAESIPVNFLIPMEGTGFPEAKGLNPEYCLRILCLFRFLNPRAELRMAAGREIHLRSLEAMGLCVANSLFLQGYLNARGSTNAQTLQMIKDLGFTIESEISLDEVLLRADDHCSQQGLKGKDELRPFAACDKTC